MTLKELASNMYEITPGSTGRSYYRIFDFLEYDFNRVPEYSEHKEITGSVKIKMEDSLYVIEFIEVDNNGDVNSYTPNVVFVLSKYEECKRNILGYILCGNEKCNEKLDCNRYDGLRNEWHVKLSEIKLIYNELLEWTNIYLGNSAIEEEIDYAKLMIRHRYLQIAKMADSCKECKRCDKERNKLIKL